METVILNDDEYGKKTDISQAQINKRKRRFLSIENASVTKTNENGDNDCAVEKRKLTGSDVKIHDDDTDDDDDIANGAPAPKYREIEAKTSFLLHEFCDEVLFEIFKYLDSWSLLAVQNSCDRFHALIMDRRFWTHIDLTQQPLPQGILQDILERTHLNTACIKLRGPPPGLHVKDEFKQFTYTLCRSFATRCRELRVLELHGITIDFRCVRITDFPKTLTRLVFNECNVSMPECVTSMFTGIDSHLLLLEELGIEFNEWFEPYHIMILSKIATLRWLSLKGCNQLFEMVPYGSMAARFGFKKLEYLDLRFTPITDSDLQCFNAVVNLKELLLDCPRLLRCSKEKKKCNVSEAITTTNSTETDSTTTASIPTTTIPTTTTTTSASTSTSTSPVITIRNISYHDNPTSSSSKPSAIVIDDEQPSTSATSLHSITSAASTAALNNFIKLKAIDNNAAHMQPIDFSSSSSSSSSCSSNSSINSPTSITISTTSSNSLSSSSSSMSSACSITSSSSSSSSSSSVNSTASNTVPSTISTSGPAVIVSDVGAGVAAANSGVINNVGVSNVSPHGRHLRHDQVIYLDFQNRRRPIILRGSQRRPQHPLNLFDEVVSHPLFWDMINPLSRYGANVARTAHGRCISDEDGNDVFNAAAAAAAAAAGEYPLEHRRQGCFLHSRAFNRLQTRDRYPISDRGICCFGRPQNPVDQGVIWIRIGNRPNENRFERLIVRNYKQVTDISLQHLVQCSPNLSYLDLTGTSVTLNGVRAFKERKPECEVLANHLLNPTANTNANANDCTNEDIANEFDELLKN